MKFKMFEKVSFRQSEQTSFDAIAKRTRLSLKPGEVVVLLSQSEDQLMFVGSYLPIGEDGAAVLTSRRLRLTKGTWDVLKLKEYARVAGLRVDDWSVLDKSMRRAHVVVATAAHRALKAA